MTILKKILMHSNATIREAIDVLNKEKMRIVIIVDNDKKIEGTVTDGDIRRGLVQHLSINDVIKLIMHKNPTTANCNNSKHEILEKIKSKNLLSIPIVDNNNVVVGVETLQNLTKKQQYNNPIVIMAGGKGKRLMPLTEHSPKPLLHVGERPILETIIKQFIDAGIRNDKRIFWRW